MSEQHHVHPLSRIFDNLLSLQRLNRFGMSTERRRVWLIGLSSLLLSISMTGPGTRAIAFLNLFKIYHLWSSGLLSYQSYMTICPYKKKEKDKALAVLHRNENQNIMEAVPKIFVAFSESLWLRKILQGKLFGSRSLLSSNYFGEGNGIYTLTVLFLFYFW